jgi:transposase-like protein/IS1 family transposase
MIRTCPNPRCRHHSRRNTGNVIRHGFARLKRGKRRRYLCKTCGKTFCSTVGTPYCRIQRSKNTFDEVCLLSVEGVCKAVIARVKRLSWNTVDRWLERASHFAGRYHDRMVHSIRIQELQADEIRSFIDHKRRPVYIITAIAVWSRMWLACGLGRRNFRNILRLFRDVLCRTDPVDTVLITTDGFAPYGWVIRRVFGHGCVYGQVIKTRRKNRIVRVERKLLIGTREQIEDALLRSEDSDRLNTAFVERHNLTIRRNCAYLHRRTTAHARCADRLREQLELLRCYYNFIRPHMALKFGRLTKTPAMQAGLVDRPLTFRQIFTSEVTGKSSAALVILGCRRLSWPVLKLAA